MTLVDSNVLIDLATGDPEWADRSVSALEQAAFIGPLMINDVIYAELSVRYDRIEALNDFIEQMGLRHAAMPTASLSLAAKAFRNYRHAGGQRTGVLPDFFIGAHAAVLGVALLTRDVGRYRTYFPNVGLICPL